LIEQSGVLQQLAGMLTSNLSALQSSGMTDGQSGGTLAPVRLSGQIFVQLQLLRGLQHLHSPLHARMQRPAQGSNLWCQPCRFA
jgi:hypothetical protein